MTARVVVLALLALFAPAARAQSSDTTLKNWVSFAPGMGFANKDGGASDLILMVSVAGGRETRRFVATGAEVSLAGGSGYGSTIVTGVGRVGWAPFVSAKVGAGVGHATRRGHVVVGFRPVAIGAVEVMPLSSWIRGERIQVAIEGVISPRGAMARDALGAPIGDRIAEVRLTTRISGRFAR